MSGVGETRTFTRGRVTVLERVAEKTPLRRYVHVLLSGLPLRDCTAQIDLSENIDGGTHISSHTTFRPRFLGTGGLYHRPLDGATRGFVEGLGRKAEDHLQKTGG